MTDNEIIEAYENKVNLIGSMSDVYLDEKYGFDLYDVMTNTLDFINRLQAEIERLQNTIIALLDYLDRLGIDKTDTSIVRIATELNAQIRANVKSEAIEEFVEKLKMQVASLEYNAKTPRKTVPVQTLYEQINWILKDIIPKTIDGVLKEMEGEE